MPAWQERVRPWVQEGKLVVLGVAQEQHPDRCRLFAQWKRLDWPIVYDPINVLGVTGVPLEVAVDERGIVRSTRLDLKTVEQPVELHVLPTGSELAQPARQFAADPGDVQPPDPQDRIRHDVAGLVRAEVTVVPPRVKAGQSARVHITLRPNAQRQAHWNNEAEPLQLWIDPAEGWQLERRLFQAPQDSQPESSEPRRFEFDVRAPANARDSAQLHAYALYYVCEDVGGTCLFLRLDVPIDVSVEK